MKTINTPKALLLLILLLAGFIPMAQQSNNQGKSQKSNQTEMKTFLIEREIPGAGSLKPEQLKSISQTSCSVIKELGPAIQWMHSYVTGDKIFCIYKAENEAILREHAKRGGFPANKITQINTTISPATADE